jgi:hypothetical protein
MLFGPYQENKKRLVVLLAETIIEMLPLASFFLLNVDVPLPVVRTKMTKLLLIVLAIL